MAREGELLAALVSIDVDLPRRLGKALTAAMEAGTTVTTSCITAITSLLAAGNRYGDAAPPLAEWGRRLVAPLRAMFERGEGMCEADLARAAACLTALSASASLVPRVGEGIPAFVAAVRRHPRSGGELLSRCAELLHALSGHPMARLVLMRERAADALLAAIAPGPGVSLAAAAPAEDGRPPSDAPLAPVEELRVLNALAARGEGIVRMACTRSSRPYWCPSSGATTASASSPSGWRPSRSSRARSGAFECLLLFATGVS